MGTSSMTKPALYRALFNCTYGLECFNKHTKDEKAFFEQTRDKEILSGKPSLAFTTNRINARKKSTNALMLMEMKMPGVLTAEPSVDILPTTVHAVLQRS